MPFKFAKSIIKTLDHFQSGFLTINKIFSSRSSFGGIHTNILIGENKYRNSKNESKENLNLHSTDTEIIKDKNKSNNITPNDRSDQNLSYSKKEDTTKIDIPKVNGEDKLDVKNGESFLIKTDKLNFVGKHSRIPVSPMSRAFNFGILGVAMIGSGITNMMIDKVFIRFKLRLV